MKTSTHAQSATSIPRAPRDEVGSRSMRYLIMMGVRVACFILMVTIQPYGWYTWVFGAAAIFLPYIAVVLANVGQDGKAVHAENPERELEAAAPAVREPEASAPPVILITETHPAAIPPAGDAS
ncbi:MAG: DUF3099 domain-containing protein [Microbacterium sp.]|uniref:DUF3099 domain-containing protein n=1 Tax=Microbacterium sp. TaxID=51671 RepID=UPI001AC93AA5|nr:DUF3099 domain-containing protein [Microbacterium sp.]MBN9152576.1 DUF3099 domain-containing protein [Microbacterium sp.]MBN9174752.1 DUF3099 domain-containing protein [Microbacterium sp.]